MEQIFKSQACLNGSFLLSQDKHFSCSSRNYGMDLKAAQAAFDNLRKVENQSIKQVVSCRAWDLQSGRSNQCKLNSRSGTTLPRNCSAR